MPGGGSAKKANRGSLSQVKLPELKKSINQSIINEAVQNAPDGPKIYFPQGVKRISGLDIPLQRERNISLLQGQQASAFLKAPNFQYTQSQLQLTDGSQTHKPNKLLPLGKMPSLMSQQASLNIDQYTLVSPTKTNLKLKKNDFQTVFVPTGPLPNNERILQLKGSYPDTISIMQAHEQRLQAMSKKPAKIVFEDEGEAKKLEIEESPNIEMNLS